MKSSGDYTSPPILYCRKSSEEDKDDNNPFQFHFPDSPPKHEYKHKHDTWPPPPLPFAARLSQYIQHGDQDGVEDMWSEMRARILEKVDIYRRERKGDEEEEERGWENGGMDMRDVKGWIECELGEGDQRVWGKKIKEFGGRVKYKGDMGAGRKSEVCG
jgi:hypothetical protein